MNGNGRAILPPTAVTAVSHYAQPPRRTKTGTAVRILVGFVLLAVAAGAGIAGGSYLWAHRVVEEIQAHSKPVVKAEKALDVPLPNAPAIALVIGYDHRAGVEANRPSLSDTLMLIRTDPVNNTISLLSFPRDLPSRSTAGARERAQPDQLGLLVLRPEGHGAHVKHLTGLPINYLITVDFHGFKEVVDQLGGVWMDVDRRYYNKNVGTASTDYANIDLQPGYQRLNGEQALDFVRYRHTDSDLYRVARQQEFVRSFSEQVAQNFSFARCPPLSTRSPPTSRSPRAVTGCSCPNREVREVRLHAAGAGTSSRIRSRASVPEPVLRRPVRHRRGRPAVHEPRCLVLEASECGGARQEDQAHDPAAVDRDD